MRHDFFQAWASMTTGVPSQKGMVGKSSCFVVSFLSCFDALLSLPMF